MWLMLILLLILLIIIFVHEKTFISPSFLMLVSYIFAIVIMIYNKNNWMVSISVEFFFCVIISAVSWVLGKFFLDKVIKVKVPRYQFVSKKPYPYTAMLVLSLLLFSVIVFVTIADSLKSGMNITDLFRSIYVNKLSSSSGHFLLHQFEKFLVAIGYLSFYQLVHLYYFRTGKNYKLLLKTFLTFLISILSMILSTDRNVFIRLCIFCYIIWYYCYRKKYMHRVGVSKFNKKVVLKTLIMGCSFILIFYFMGKIKQYSSDLERMIGIYGGSGLNNFNIYLKQFDGKFTYGNSTLNTILGVLKSLGFNKNIVVLEDLKLISFKSDNGYIYGSNIYSALQPFYRDFGFFGIIFFSFIIGFLLEYIYQKALKSPSRYHLIFYAAFAYPAVYMSIAEQFFGRMHLGIIYELFWLYVTFKLCYSTRKCKFSNNLNKHQVEGCI